MVFGQDAQVAAWVGRQLAIEDFGPCVALGVERHGEMVAGCVYNNWRHPNIEVTFATTTPRWASKEAISCILSYPFIQLGCQRITAFTKAGNERARAFLLGLGFEQEGYHPHGFSDDDAVSYGLLRENCRWVNSEVGPQSTAAN